MGPTPETSDNDDSRRATTTTASQTTTTTAATTTKPPVPPPTTTVASSSAYNSDRWGRAVRTTGRTWPRTTTSPATDLQVSETDSRLSRTVAATHAVDDVTGSDVTAPGGGGGVRAFLYHHAGDWPVINTPGARFTNHLTIYHKIIQGLF